MFYALRMFEHSIPSQKHQAWKDVVNGLVFSRRLRRAAQKGFKKVTLCAPKEIGLRARAGRPVQALLGALFAVLFTAILLNP
jgi:hypothetical protein